MTARKHDLLASSQFSFGPPIGQATKTGLALSTNYAYGTGGIAIGNRFCAPTSGNLTDVWFYVTAIKGTPGVTVVELRSYDATYPLRAGSTLHATQNITPGTTADKWINAHFSTPYAVTAGIYYWIAIGDAAGNSSNTTTVSYKSGLTGTRTLFHSMESCTTTTGFTTNATASSVLPALVMKFADGTIFGNPFTTYADYSNNTSERGLKIVNLSQPLTISGLHWNGALATFSGVKIYDGATAPGGTTLATYTFDASAWDIAYFTPYTLQKDRTYRIVFTYNGNSVKPPHYLIEDFATSTDLTNCGYGGGTVYGTIDGGAGAWVDAIDKLPLMHLLVRDSGNVIVPQRF
jgi:hypothetical protein